MSVSQRVTQKLMIYLYTERKRGNKYGKRGLVFLLDQYEKVRI